MSACIVVDRFTLPTLEPVSANMPTQWSQTHTEHMSNSVCEESYTHTCATFCVHRASVQLQPESIYVGESSIEHSGIYFEYMADFEDKQDGGLAASAFKGIWLKFFSPPLITQGTGTSVKESKLRMMDFLKMTRRLYQFLIT